MLIGGQRIGGHASAFMQPSSVADLNSASPADRKEFFGAVALLVRVAGEEAAVQLANDSPFSPGGSVFRQDIERGKRVARQTEVGVVFINAGAVSSPKLPFGSVKNLSCGRELSRAGIQEFVNKKLIRVNAGQARHRYAFPARANSLTVAARKMQRFAEESVHLCSRCATPRLSAPLRW